MRRVVLFILLLSICNAVPAQVKWQQVDSFYQPLPSSVHVYFTDTPLDTSPFRAYYLVADLKDKRLKFTADTTSGRRLTPSNFFEKNNQPLVVVNCTFFSFETNRNLNAVIKEGKLVSYNVHSLPGRGKDTFTYRHPFGSALGITRKRKADIAWLFTDSLRGIAYARQGPVPFTKDSLSGFTKEEATKAVLKAIPPDKKVKLSFSRWKMQTAVGGGPVLLQHGEITITNNEELKFTGKAIEDKHPRTAMGYTPDGKLIILVIEGRNKKAGGATLTQEAQLFKDLGCTEALNLDGGGSSCLLINGKETIRVSDAAGQRPVPAVFLISRK
ncbi:MAG: phosphodiester glycosidase family protein [Chitinophagaceae bacterium]